MQRRIIAAGSIELCSIVGSMAVGMTWPQLPLYVGLPIITLCMFGILSGIAIWLWSEKPVAPVNFDDRLKQHLEDATIAEATRRKLHPTLIEMFFDAAQAEKAERDKRDD